jgi:protein tyrosine phosphatase (PTP) superfamily phosphohydrolase (DUF442 family)
MLCVVFFCALTSCATATVGKHHDTWAKAVAAEHLPNLFLVSPKLYRSAMPDRDAGQNISALGIKTIVSLRHFHADHFLPALTPDIEQVRIPLYTWDVRRQDLMQFLQIAIDPKKQPVLVHCQHGADRTGVMVAAYRVVVQGWSKQSAVEEFEHGGFGFHPIWRGLPRLIDGLKVAQMRSELGLSEVVPAFR